MLDIKSLLPVQDKLMFSPAIDLFGNSQPWYAVKQGLCPCGRKLYEIQGRNLMICKSKKCGLYLSNKKAFICKKNI